MTDIKYKMVGFLRGLGIVVLLAVLSYVGDVKNLEFLGNPFVAGLIASVVAAVEHSIEAKKGKALFGIVKV